MRRLTFLFLALLFLPTSTPAQSSLPEVDGVAYQPFRADVLNLLQGLEKLKTLPAPLRKEVNTLLVKAPDEPDKVVAEVRKLLDAHCLAGVQINPESRVKAVRGPFRLILVRDQPSYVLVRVHNEGGVTHPLSVKGPQVVEKGGKSDEQWLEANILNDRGFSRQLTGRRLEYRVMKLTPRQTGKLEATLAFDVGQGTEDLGFRAEVPILFVVKER